MYLSFTPRKGWLDTKEHRADLATRIAQLVGWNESCPPYESPGQASGEGLHWTLNASNDWWMHVQANGTVELSYRYRWTDEQWAALKMVVEMFVGKPQEET